MVQLGRKWSLPLNYLTISSATILYAFFLEMMIYHINQVEKVCLEINYSFRSFFNSFFMSSVVVAISPFEMMTTEYPGRWFPQPDPAETSRKLSLFR